MGVSTVNRKQIREEIIANGAENIANDTGTNAVQEVTVKAKKGSFKIAFRGETTAAIAYNATAAAVQTALEALTNVGPGDIVVTGGPGDELGTKPYVLTFGGQYAETSVPAVTTDVTGLEEGTKTAAVTIKTAGVLGGPTRINRWIQQAIRELCDFKPWPFLFATKEGAAPLAIEDLGHVIAVSDLTNRNPIEPATINQLLLGDPDLTGIGQAAYWFTEDGKTITVYPAPSGGGSFKVRYRKIPVALTDEEEPIVPVDFHDLIVTRVRVKVYKDTDNFEAAAEVLKDYERERDLMVHALMKPAYDKERRLTRSGRAGDYV